MHKFIVSLIVLLQLSGVGVVTSSAWAQQIKSVSVTASGTGKSQEEAISRALVRAISQVNGEAIASSSKLSVRSDQSVTANSDGGGQSNVAVSKHFEKEIASKTKGVVKAWRLISESPVQSGEVRVDISADIFVLTRSKQLDRIKVAVVGGARSNTEFARSVISYLTDDLIKSRKVAVLDRKNDAAVQGQLDRIKRGGALEDQVRIGSELAPDLIAVVSTELSGQGTSRKRVIVTLEIIDYSSGQVKFSEKRSRLVKQDSSSRIDMMARGVAKGLHRTVIETVFPPLVVGFDEQILTIAQGRDYFAKGDRVEVRLLVRPIRDPHTSEFLSYETRLLGQAEIVSADLRISQARLVSGSIPSLEPIASGQVQVFREASDVSSIFSFDSNDDPAQGNGKNASGKSKSIFVTDRDDED